MVGDSFTLLKRACARRRHCPRSRGERIQQRPRRMRVSIFLCLSTSFVFLHGHDALCSSAPSFRFRFRPVPHPPSQEFRRLSAASAHLQSRVALFGASTSGSSAAGGVSQEEGDHVALNIGGSSSNYRYEECGAHTYTLSHASKGERCMTQRVYVFLSST